MILLKHPISGVVKRCSTSRINFGSFFFGPFVHLGHGNLKEFIVGCLIIVFFLYIRGIFLDFLYYDLHGKNTPGTYFAINAFVTFILYIIFSVSGFSANRRYIENLLDKGYKPCDESSRKWLEAHDWIFFE